MTDKKNIKTLRRFPLMLIAAIPLLFTILSCQSAGNHTDRSQEEKIAATLGTCSTGDTLLELIGQGVSAARAWHLSDSVLELDGVVRAIEKVGFASEPGSGRFDSVDIAALSKTVYQDWGITFNPCDTTIMDFFPQHVYESKKGSCLGIALLFLMVAEKYGHPFHGVAVPGHFFLRFSGEGGALRRNIEPNALGVERSDDYYRERYNISPGSWYYPLRELSRKETAAVFFYMIGNICMQRGKLAEAALCYKTSLRLFPGYPDALGNLALVFSLRRQGDSAMYYLDRAAESNPADSRIWRNKGALLLKHKRYQEAYDLAADRLVSVPDDTALLHITALAALKTGRADDAIAAAGRFRALGDSGRSRELEQQIVKRKKAKRTVPR